MAATEFGSQPVQDLDTNKDTSMDMPDEETQIPTHKSGVIVDPNAIDQTCKFQKGDIVHMNLVESGIRYRGTFTIRKARLNSSRTVAEYQLYDSSKELYLRGEWIRENKLKRS